MSETTTPETGTAVAGRGTSGLLVVAAGELLFEFHSFQDWVNNATGRFARAGVRGTDVICLDAKHRICQKGKEFMRARDDDAFPVRAYRALIDNQREAQRPARNDGSDC